jgi:hypothetical protein
VRWLWRFATVDRHVRKFYRPMAGRRLVIVRSPWDVDKVVSGTGIESEFGLRELERVLIKAGCKTSMERADRVGMVDRSAHMLSVGGPIPNAVSRAVLHGEAIAYRFGEGALDHTIVDTRGERLHEAELRGNEVLCDYGIVTRVPNPYEPQSDALVAAGCFGWGTHAALIVLSRPQNLRLFNEVGRYFQAICRCKVEGGQAWHPELVAGSVVPISRQGGLQER